MRGQLKLKRCRCGAPIDCSGAIMVEGCGVPFDVCGKCGMLREPDYEGTIRDLRARLAAAEKRAEESERVYRICRTTNDAWVVESAGDGAWERESVHATQGSARREMLRLEEEK